MHNSAMMENSLPIMRVKNTNKGAYKNETKSIGKKFVFAAVFIDTTDKRLCPKNYF